MIFHSVSTLIRPQQEYFAQFWESKFKRDLNTDPSGWHPGLKPMKKELDWRTEGCWAGRRPTHKHMRQARWQRSSDSGRLSYGSRGRLSFSRSRARTSGWQQWRGSFDSSHKKMSVIPAWMLRLPSWDNCLGRRIVVRTQGPAGHGEPPPVWLSNCCQRSASVLIYAVLRQLLAFFSLLLPFYSRKKRYFQRG